MIKFPYGDTDFYNIITQNYFFIDRTETIRQLEEISNKALFLRPRRFGKSLWLSVLENYYDVRKADQFERLFGDLTIGQNPTPLHNQYLILKWNFSTIATVGTEAELRQAMHDNLNSRMNEFQLRYQAILPHPFEIIPQNALASFDNLLAVVQTTPYNLYLMIDEYDNLANEVLMGGDPQGQARYEKLVKGEGMLKTIFKVVKNGLEGRGLDRLFITGVSPLVLSDMTSGFNVADNISLLPEFNDLCGFWEAEVSQVLNQVSRHCQLSSEQVADALQLMKTFYDGYSFSYEQDGRGGLYNPTLVLYFLKNFQRYCKYPRRLLDSNLAMDSNKIAYIAQLQQGEQIILQALDETTPLTIFELADQFGLQEMLQQHHDRTFMVSLLYYFGVVTLAQQERPEELILDIPNLVIRKLYVEQLYKMLLPQAKDMHQADWVTRQVYQQGNVGPLCEFLERRQFTVFDNRDYGTADELTIKAVFLTVLFNDTLYIMDSEPALQRRYGDLIMIIRPDMRGGRLWDLLFEFKYLSLGKNNLTGEQVQGMSQAELLALKPVQAELADARTQLITYRTTLEKVYGVGYLRLRTYAIVSIGYDRLVWQEIA